MTRTLIALGFFAFLATSGLDMRGVAAVFLVLLGITALSYAAEAYARNKRTARYAPRVQTRAVKRLRPVPLVEYPHNAIHDESDAEFPEMAARLPPELHQLVLRGLSEEAKKREG